MVELGVPQHGAPESHPESPPPNSLSSTALLLTDTSSARPCRYRLAQMVGQRPGPAAQLALEDTVLGTGCVCSCSLSSAGHGQLGSGSGQEALAGAMLCVSFGLFPA